MLIGHLKQADEAGKLIMSLMSHTQLQLGTATGFLATLPHLETGISHQAQNRSGTPMDPTFIKRKR
jgi:hypothetical protein